VRSVGSRQVRVGSRLSKKMKRKSYWEIEESDDVQALSTSQRRTVIENVFREDLCYMMFTVGYYLEYRSTVENEGILIDSNCVNSRIAGVIISVIRRLTEFCLIRAV
jgi:hypothetical protein